jgi:GT2 family glycosyltransferase
MSEGLLTKNCVESIKKNVSLDYEIIVVDNGSKIETLDILRSLPGIRLIETNKNLGFPAGCNTGLAQARGKKKDSSFSNTPISCSVFTMGT